MCRLSGVSSKSQTPTWIGLTGGQLSRRSYGGNMSQGPCKVAGMPRGDLRDANGRQVGPRGDGPARPPASGAARPVTPASSRASPSPHTTTPPTNPHHPPHTNATRSAAAGRLIERVPAHRVAGLGAVLVGTALFLLIMGIVSTAVFDHHLTSQFEATILAESTRSPGDFTQLTAPRVAAVEVTFRPFAVRPLTTSSPLVTAALATAVRRMGPGEVIRAGRSDHLFPVTAAGRADYQLRAAARLIPAAQNLLRQQSVLVVAEQATALRRQLRGLILLEMITGGGLIALLAAGGPGVVGPGP